MSSWNLEENSSGHASQEDILKLDDDDFDDQEGAEQDVLEPVAIDNIIDENDGSVQTTISHSPTPEESPLSETSNSIEGFLSPDSDGYFSINPVKNFDRQRYIHIQIRI